VSREKILFTTRTALSNSVIPNLEYIVYVDPKAYDLLPTYERKMEIASVVNLLNKNLSEKRYALMGPGRWGSNDINLGVRVTYSNINKTKLLVEIAFAKNGLTPEVSYGTHFFQDLVEADIAIVPLYPDDPKSVFNEEFLIKSPNVLKEIVEDTKDGEEVVRVIHLPSVGDGHYLQVFLSTQNQRSIGLFGPFQESK